MSLMLSCSTSTKSVAVKMPSEQFESKFEGTETCLMLLMRNYQSLQRLPANSLTAGLTDYGANSLTSSALKPSNRLMRWGQPKASFLQNAFTTCQRLRQRCVNTMLDTKRLLSNCACANTLRLLQTTLQSEVRVPLLLTF